MAGAQSPAVPAFEAATIKIAAPFDGNRGNAFYNYEDTGGPGTATPGQWICRNVPLQALILKAWNIMPNRLSGRALPDVRYDIAAKIPMIQHLLGDQLGLTVHMAPVEQPVLDLVIAKGGIRLKPAEPPPANPAKDRPRVEWDSDKTPHLPPGQPGVFHAGISGSDIVLVGRMQTVAELIRELEGPARHTIVDRTGLTGKYDYSLRYDPGIETTADPDAPPPLMTALTDQLGLKLEPAKERIDMLFVDGFHKEPRPL
jgi:uncharacterized protein (TIGR03435 family)